MFLSHRKIAKILKISLYHLVKNMQLFRHIVLMMENMDNNGRSEKLHVYFQAKRSSVKCQQER